MSGSSDRAARLTALVTALNAWATVRIQQINDTVASQQKMIAARGTAAQSATDAGTSIVANRLSEFTG